jgi:hypothetical protein
MPLSNLINRPCTLLRRSASADDIDEAGDAVRSETAVAAVWELQQRRRDEPSDQGELSVTTWDAFFLPGTELDGTDQIVDGPTGHLYELVGDPWEARNPRSGFRQIEATVQRAGGAPQGS